MPRYVTAGILAVLALTWGTPSPALAQPDLDEVEIDGLLLDQTLSRNGKLFFAQLIEKLESPDGLPGAQITVREQVSPQWGSLIWIELNGATIFRTVLRPRLEGVEEAAAQGAQTVLLTLLQQALQASAEPAEMDF